MFGKLNWRNFEVTSEEFLGNLKRIWRNFRINCEKNKLGFIWENSEKNFKVGVLKIFEESI